MSSFRYERHGSVFLARRLHKLRELITDQSDEVFIHEGITAPSHCVSVLLYLNQTRNCSISKIADKLGYSHQLINYRLTQLTDLGFVERIQDDRDRRRRLMSLTKKGRSEVHKIETALPKIAATFDHLFEDIGVELNEALSLAFQQLKDRPLVDRIQSEVASCLLIETVHISSTRVVQNDKN